MPHPRRFLGLADGQGMMLVKTKQAVTCEVSRRSAGLSARVNGHRGSAGRTQPLGQTEAGCGNRTAHVGSHGGDEAHPHRRQDREPTGPAAQPPRDGFAADGQRRARGLGLANWRGGLLQVVVLWLVVTPRLLRLAPGVVRLTPIRARIGRGRRLPTEPPA